MFATSHSPHVTVIAAVGDRFDKEWLSDCFSSIEGFLLDVCGDTSHVWINCSPLLPSVLLIDEARSHAADFPEWVNSLKFGKNLQLLVIGQADSAGNAKRVLRAGCAGLVSLNVSVATLRRAVRSVAAGELWASREVVSQLIREFISAETDPKLSPREMEILRLIGQGMTNRQIAEHLSISGETVRWHVRGLYSKIGVKDRLSAAIYAVDHIAPLAVEALLAAV